jgi:hypothetical protein
MFSIKLQWKEFSVDLRGVDTKMRLDYPTYIANQANSEFELYFESEPSEQEKTDIQAYWDALTDQSAEAQSYESQADIETARLAKVASAKTKLEALGLTADEVKAILG